MIHRHGPAITVVVLGLLSLVAGLRLFSVAKTIAPADGNGTATQNSADGKGAAAQIPWEILAEAQVKLEPDPAPVSWPPQTIAFAGKQAAEEWSANGLGMKFCWCPPGTFTMGSPKDEKDREPQYSQFSEDQVEVNLTKGFWLAKYETTQGQWAKVMGTTLMDQFEKFNEQVKLDYANSGKKIPWSAWAQSSGEGPNYPMYYVNHAEATAFCQKLTEQERQAGRLPPGWEYRLPTDAQWEYACRAGTKTATAYGDSLSSSQANFHGFYPYNGAPKGQYLGRMQPVGSYRPNAWGLCDMHGNAAEWCRDCYQAKLPGGTNPEVRTNAHSTIGDANKVVRGGSWQSGGSDCRSARRFGNEPTKWDNSWGFRVVAVLVDPKLRPAPPPDPKPSPRGTIVNSIGMKLAPIPAGVFLMGSPTDEIGRPASGLGRHDYETQHEATIREPFYLGIYLVTQGQYEYLMGDSPMYIPSSYSKEGFERDKVADIKDTQWFPQDTVAWDAAQEFCRRLSDLPEEKKRGRVYRLPTEAEWEYACRAGTTTRYYFGNDISPNQANFNGNVGRTTPVGYYANPNKFGLYDMHGNLWEWCDDILVPYQEDPINLPPTTSRVMRGGSFINYSIDCRSASRSLGGGFGTFGFRVALPVSAKTP
jgi:formylglycine-generating enzyme required for sulfatase activity